MPEILRVQEDRTSVVFSDLYVAFRRDGLPAGEEKSYTIERLGHELVALFDEIFMPAIVRVQERNPARCCRPDSKVASCGEASLHGIRPAKHVYSRILKSLDPFKAAVRRGIVHNNDFVDGPRLSQYRRERSRDIRFLVVQRDHGSDGAGCNVQPPPG